MADIFLHLTQFSAIPPEFLWVITDAKVECGRAQRPVSPPSPLQRHPFFHARYKPGYFFFYSIFSPFRFFFFFGFLEESVSLPSADSAFKHVIEEATASADKCCVSHNTHSRSESWPSQQRQAVLVTQVAGERPRLQGCKMSRPSATCAGATKLRRTNLPTSFSHSVDLGRADFIPPGHLEGVCTGPSR